MYSLKYNVNNVPEFLFQSEWMHGQTNLTITEHLFFDHDKA